MISRISSGPERGEQAGPVEALETGQAFEADREPGRTVLGNVHPAHDAGPAAVGDDGRARVSSEAQQIAHLLPGRWEGDAVGDRSGAAGSKGDPVRQALAARVAQADLGVAIDQAVGREAAGAHGRHDIGQERIPGRRARADDPPERSQPARGDLVADRLIAPTVPAPHEGRLLQSGTRRGSHGLPRF